jgi:hypothetical protein
MYAPAKPTDVETLSDPAQLEPFDAFLIGIPTRYVFCSPCPISTPLISCVQIR